MSSKHCDAYIIGDKLQSIWGNNNIFTYLENNDLPPPITIRKTAGINQVRRFHIEFFKTFVNNAIPFRKYNLPPIKKICDTVNCKYDHTITDSVVIKYIKNDIKSNDTDNKSLSYDLIIKWVIECMQSEISKYNYTPENFMFIFPFITINKLAELLYYRLQVFWINQFSKESYRYTLKSHKYWSTYDVNEAYQFVYLHKSDEGASINLRESNNATRLLSIHASKGTGREVVFVLGLSESALKRYSHGEINIQYDSLLHVAITRQKQKLYINIQNNNDDIAHRLNNSGAQYENNADFPNELSLRSKLKIQDLMMFRDFESFNKIFLIMEQSNNLDKDKSTKNKNIIIDMGHHILRKVILLNNLHKNIFNNETCENDKDQYKTILRHICQANIEKLKYSQYINKIQSIENINNHNREPVIYIPRLDSSKSNYATYNNITNDIEKIIVNIQKQLQQGIETDMLPTLCPLESIIFIYVLLTFQSGIYADIKIMDVYTVMFTYRLIYSKECYHADYNCLCNDMFKDSQEPSNTQENAIKTSILKHYELIKQCDKLYNKYKKQISDLRNDGGEFTYNLNKHISMSIGSYNIYMFSDLIAYNDKYVINFIIQPQLTKLNFGDTYMKIIRSHYILSNQKNSKGTNRDGLTNYQRYSDKTIIHYVYTVDKVYYYEDLTDIFKNNKDNISELFKNMFIKYYSQNNKRLFTWFQSELKDGRMSDINNKLEKLEPTPLYIRPFWDQIVNDLKKGIRTKEATKELLTISLNIFDDYMKHTIRNNLIDIDELM
jgi:hypothetical protein